MSVPDEQALALFRAVAVALADERLADEHMRSALVDLDATAETVARARTAVQDARHKTAEARVALVDAAMAGA